MSAGRRRSGFPTGFFPLPSHTLATALGQSRPAQSALSADSFKTTCKNRGCEHSSATQLRSPRPSYPPPSLSGPRDSAQSPTVPDSRPGGGWGSSGSKPVLSPGSRSLHCTPHETCAPCMQRHPSAPQGRRCLRSAGSGERLQGGSPCLQ